MKNTRILNRLSAGSEFFSRGMSYHSHMESIRTFQHIKGREIIGTIFVFDSDKGFEQLVLEFDNLHTMNVGKSYAPEIKKPALLVLSQAEYKRQIKRDVV